MEEEGGGPFSWLKPEWEVIKGAPWSFAGSVLFFGAIILISTVWFFHENIERKDDLIGSLRLSEENLKSEVAELKKKPVAIVQDEQKQKLLATVTITGRSYANEIVDIDGKIFDRCTFTNATLLYHGTGSATFIDPKLVGSLMFESDSQAVRGYLELLHFFKTRPNIDTLKMGTKDIATGNFKPFETISFVPVQSNQDKKSSP
jgi:hypothetical protein